MDRDLKFQTGMCNGRDVLEAKECKNSSILYLKEPLIIKESPHVLIQKKKGNGGSYREAECPW